MVKINRTYIDPALNLINEQNTALVDTIRSRQNALKAASTAAVNKSQAELVFRSNVSRGIMVALILVALGLLIALSAGPVSRALNGDAQNSGNVGFFSVPPPTVANTSDADSSTITQSVTLFNTVPFNESGSPFSKVVAGHVFNKVTDQNWSSAYCYAWVANSPEKISVDLSSYDSPDSNVTTDMYTPNLRFSEDDFVAAQARCPYQRSNY